MLAKANLKFNSKNSLLLNNNCINLSTTGNGLITETNNAMDLTMNKKVCMGGSTSSSLSSETNELNIKMENKNVKKKHTKKRQRTHKTGKEK